MSEKIYLNRVVDGTVEPYEIWTADKAAKMSLNHAEDNEICEIMENIKTEAFHDKNYTLWICEPSKDISKEKILSYLHYLGYKTAFYNKNDMDVYTYEISW